MRASQLLLGQCVQKARAVIEHYDPITLPPAAVETEVPEPLPQAATPEPDPAHAVAAEVDANGGGTKAGPSPQQARAVDLQAPVCE